MIKTINITRHVFEIKIVLSAANSLNLRVGSLLLTLESNWLGRRVVGNVAEDDLSAGACNRGIE